MANYTPRTLYEQSFNMDFQWVKHLEPTVHTFHDLMRRELNTPVELQMGTILPFIAACAGPTTRSLFFTQPSVLNLFWMNIAASGVGKSQSRKKFIAEPLEFMMRLKDIEVPDFEVWEQVYNVDHFLCSYIFIFYKSLRQEYSIRVFDRSIP